MKSDTKRSNRRKRGKRGLLLLAAAALYLWAAVLCARAEAGTGTLYLRLDRPVDPEKARQLLALEEAQDQPVGFCFFGEALGGAVSCPQTGRSAQVTAVLLAGNPELLGAGSLAWQDGCLIDPETAKTLFGTGDCGGQTLSWEGLTLRVLGTVSAPRPTLYAPARDGDGQCLDRCVLTLPAGKSQTLAESALLRWGLRGTVTDLYPMWTVAKNLLLTVPALLMLALARRVSRLWRELTLERVVCLALGLAVLVLGGRLLLGQAVIPPDMIPSKWSDFSFWGTWLEAQKENFFRILQAPLGNEQLQMLLDMVKSMVSSTAAAMLTLWALGRDDRADTAD